MWQHSLLLLLLFLPIVPLLVVGHGALGAGSLPSSSLRKTGAVPKDRVVVPWRNVVPEKPRCVAMLGSGIWPTLAHCCWRGIGGHLYHRHSHRKPEAEARALAEPAGAGDGDAGRVCRQWAYYDTCTNKNCRLAHPAVPVTERRLRHEQWVLAKKVVPSAHVHKLQMGAGKTQLIHPPRVVFSKEPQEN